MPGASTRKFIAKDVSFSRRVRIYNNGSGSLAILEGDPLVFSSGTVQLAADANTIGIHGVACEDIANAAYGWMWIEGIFQAAVNGTVDFSQGSAVYTAASSEVDAGTANDYAVGYIVDSDPASGADPVIFILRSVYLDSTKHA